MVNEMNTATLQFAAFQGLGRKTLEKGINYASQLNYPSKLKKEEIFCHIRASMSRHKAIGNISPRGSDERSAKLVNMA